MCMCLKYLFGCVPLPSSLNLGWQGRFGGAPEALQRERAQDSSLAHSQAGTEQVHHKHGLATVKPTSPTLPCSLHLKDSIAHRCRNPILDLCLEGWDEQTSSAPLTCCFRSSFSHPRASIYPFDPAPVAAHWTPASPPVHPRRLPHMQLSRDKPIPSHHWSSKFVRRSPIGLCRLYVILLPAQVFSW